MGQTWFDLLFAHWPMPVESLRPVVPPQLPLDTYGGSAWVGVTPFVVRGVRLRLVPPLPWISSFPEINVRTYVTVEDKPGIYFFSLDADSRAAVFAARRAYRLPYFHSRISVATSGGEITYSARRRSRDGPSVAFEATYQAVGPAAPPSPGSLEHWLTERYCLYVLGDRQRLHRAEIHHPPWPLRAARAQIRANTMADPFGLELGSDPLLHYSARQDVALWPIHVI